MIYLACSKNGRDCSYFLKNCRHQEYKKSVRSSLMSHPMHILLYLCNQGALGQSYRCFMELPLYL